MRRLVSFLLLGLLGLVQALSSSGNRLLAIIEETAEKDKYSKLWDDLEGKSEPLPWWASLADAASLFRTRL